MNWKESLPGKSGLRLSNMGWNWPFANFEGEHISKFPMQKVMYFHFRGEDISSSTAQNWMIESWRCSIANHASAPRPHHHISRWSRFSPKTSLLVRIVIFSNQSDLFPWQVKHTFVCGLLQNIFQLFYMRTSLSLDIFIFLELQVQTCTKDAKQANKSVFLRLFPTSFCFETAGLRVSHILSRWKS